MMKLICLVLAVGIFAIESEAWGRFRVPKIRRWVPRIRVRRLVPKPITTVYEKGMKTFKNTYKKVCGDSSPKSNCDYSLVTRVKNVCNPQSCLKRRLRFALGKRSLEAETQNDQPLKEEIETPKIQESKRTYWTYAKLAYKGGSIYNKCCLNACRDSDIVTYCV